MRRGLKVGLGLVLVVAAVGQTASAQWGGYYPRRYGGYGWGGWGADPQAGYMAGLGAYARGAGVYEVDDAKARAINLDTMLKWNKALRARQAALREDQKKADAAKLAAEASRGEQERLRDGATLNDLLARIYDFDPGAVKSSRSTAPLGGAAIREIPFEWDTEALTICLDQMTGDDALPAALTEPRFVGQRNALRQAVTDALKEDAKGNVSEGTKKRLDDAIAAFRTEFVKTTPDYDLSYPEADAYFVTMASIARLLNDPGLKQILAQLRGRGTGNTDVGDLIAFMQTYNLRFGPATTDRQVGIYRTLAGQLQAILNDVDDQPSQAAAPDRTGKPLQTAAKDVFQGLGWNQLNAHAQP